MKLIEARKFAKNIETVGKVYKFEHEGRIYEADILANCTHHFYLVKEENGLQRSILVDPDTLQEIGYNATILKDH